MRNLREMTREELENYLDEVVIADEEIYYELITERGFIINYFANGCQSFAHSIIEDSKEAIKNLSKNMKYYEDYHIELLTDLYLDRIAYFQPVAELNDEWKHLLKAPKELENKLLDLQYQAYEIMIKCGFDRIAGVDFYIDSAEYYGIAGYYIKNTNDIVIHRYMLEEKTNKEIIEVILHEYVHAFVCKRLSYFDKKAFSDNSIIFSGYITRLNKKLRKLGYCYKVKQNDLREQQSLYNMNLTNIIRKISDCRKSTNTTILDSIDLIEELNEKYGTVELLNDKGIEIELNGVA